VPVLKYLGVTLDPKLCFDCHTANISIRAKRAIGALHRSVGKWVGKRIFSEIYAKKLLPIVSFALPVASPRCRIHWETLEKVHRFAARLATNNYRDSYSTLLQTLHWKPLARHCFERQLTLVYKWCLGSRYLPDGVFINRPQPGRQLRGPATWHRFQKDIPDDIFQLPRSRRPFREQHDSMPLHYAIVIWNLLPLEIHDMPFSLFKKEIRKWDFFNAMEESGVNLNNGRFISPVLSKFYEVL